MPQDLTFACRCGALTGTLHDAAPHTVGHLVCYCRDCRAFVRHLGQDDQLEPGGGVPLIQTVPARIDIATGAEHIACKKLTDKGLLRWYAACCDTPLANTPKTAKLPFAGMWRGLFTDTAAFGPVAARGFTKSALPDPAAPAKDKGLARMLGGVVQRIAAAYMTGTARKNLFFDAAGQPVVTPVVLSADERRASFDP